MAKARRGVQATKMDDGVKCSLEGDPSTDPDTAADVHMRALGAATYCHALVPHLGKLLEGINIPVSAHQLMDWLMREMAPRDALEEMLCVQALLAHVRVLHLTKLSSSQTEIKSVQIVNEYADRASNTFRRLMLALAEYRKPPRAGDSFTAIKQANIANQQVIQNGKTRSNTTNEQGLPAASAPALPADSGGAGLPELIGTAEQTVGAAHRSSTSRGYSAKQQERLAARREVGRCH